MKEDKKIQLEKKLHFNILDIIDEFMADYNVKITKLEYLVTIDSEGDPVYFTLITDMK